MLYVVDASVVLKWFLPEPGTAAADALLEQFLNNEAEFIAPDLLLLEIASALWKRAIRKDLLPEEAIAVYRDLIALPLPLVPSGQFAEAALSLALRHNHSIYDLLYCALAIERNGELVTADQTLVNKLGTDFPFITHLSTIKP